MNGEQFGKHSQSESPELIHRHDSPGRELAGEETEQRAERQHVARCAFEILGVTVRSRMPLDSTELLASEASEQDRMTSSLISVLGPDQSITFVYEGGGLQPLRWQIIGEAASHESASHAEESLRNIQHALMTVLESRRSYYRFRPVAEDEAEKVHGVRHKWVGLIHPCGTQVRDTKGHLGFRLPDTRPEEDNIALYLPHYTRDRARAFSSIVTLLMSSRLPLRIAVTLQSCHLSRKQEHALKAARDLVLDRGPHSDLPAHLENAANSWLRTLAGCRVTCAVWSSRPVPATFLRMLGGEIYLGAVNVCCRKVEASRSGGLVLMHESREGLLDLRNCIPSMSPLPSLFPQPETLAGHGMRRCFNRGRLVLPDGGILMGRVEEDRSEQRVRLCQTERNRHLYILGATGTGKSTLLYNLIMQDIQRGEGVCLVDPHGDLYQQVRESVPSHRARDVVVLDPCDRERAVGINLLECAGSFREMQVNFVINEVLAILEKLYDLSVVGGPMFESYFRNALQLVMSDPSKASTLVDMPAVFEHKAYRDAMIKRCGPSLLTDFWRMAENASGEARIANLAPYIVSKLNLFIHNAMLRPIIGQAKSTVDFRQIMDDRGILLVNLSRGALGVLDMRLLGMIVLTKLICAAMTRLNVAPSRRKPFMVYVDEFQHFATDATSSLLSESRKFGLCLTLANQNLSQLSVGKGHENIVHSVLGNVGSMALFRLGAPDAEKLAVYTRPHFGPEDLQALPNFHAASRLLTPTGPTEPFIFETYPALRRESSPAVLRRIYIATYIMQHVEVDSQG